MESKKPSLPSASEFTRAVLEWSATISREFHRNEAINAMADHFNLSSKEKRELTPISRQPRYENRTSRAISNLKVYGLLKWREPGRYEITELGRAELSASAGEISLDYLNNKYSALP